MEYAALFSAALALLLVLKQRGEVGFLRDALTASEARHGPAAGIEELAEALQTQRQWLARLAAGEPLDPEQILEGRAYGDVNQARALELMERGVRLVDVRTPRETVAGILPGAICMPLDELPERFGELGPVSTPTLVYCAMGVRSAAACEFLGQQGFASLYNLEAGYSTWSGPSELPSP